MWNLYDKNNNIVSPLLYSNGKGQDAIVTEITKTFESYDIIFLQGAVGTGKSAIALSVANNLGSGIIVVPTKILQKQYLLDYCEGNYKILKNNGDWLKISLIKGRNNFICPYDGSVRCNYKSLPCIKVLPKRGGKPISRLEIASECPFFSPIVRSDLELLYCNELNCELESLKYESVKGSFSILRRKEQICPYYQQYQNHI